MSAIGTSLRDARQRAGLGLRQAARLAGCSHVAVLHAESGKRIPEAPLLCALAGVYGIDADELCRMAGRIPVDVQALLLAEPNRLAAVRAMWTPQPHPPEADSVDTEETEQ